MAQNITLLGASYSDVPAVQLPKTGGGTATFTDVTDTTAAAADVATGKYFYTAAGTRTQGTNSGGGGGGPTLIYTSSLGSMSTSSTSATNANKSLSIASSTGWQNYDMLIVDISVDTNTNNRHTSTVSLIMVTGQSNVGTKDTYTIASNKWNSKLSSNGTGSTRQSTTAYGIYAYSVSVSSNTMSIPLYYRYNSNNTGTINGSYTARVYGVKLYDLIGG